MNLGEQFQRVQQAIAGLQESVKQLFVPDPRAALKMRPNQVDRLDSQRKRAVTVPFSPFPVSLWESSALDTKGYTLHNGFSSLRIRPLSVPPGQPTPVVPDTGIELFVSLQGAYGSTWSEIDRQPVNFRGAGSYNPPLVQGQTLSTGIRFVLLGRADEEFHNQQLRVDCWVTMVAGLRF